MDRIGFRLPDSCIASSDYESAADNNNNSKVQESTPPPSTRRASKRSVLQRSLTPHFDCCPTAMHEGKGKQFPRWRPIQCMLSLTENEAPETGGFECVRGFHRHFAQYYSSGKGSSCSQRGPVGASFLFDEADGIYLCFLESVTSTSLILLCMCVCVCVCVKQNRALLARRVRQFAKEISAPSALRRTGPSLRHLNMLQ